MLGIITFDFARNYGAFLQCFALQRILPNSVVLTEKNAPSSNYICSFVGKGLRRKYPFFWPLLIPICWFRSHCHDGLNFAEWKYSIKLKPVEDADVKELETVVCGSDQIWNSNFISGKESFYFANNLPENTKRISYAASLGVPSWPEKFERTVLPMLKKFSAISVREESSISYLKSIGFENVQSVCDPTILHNGDFYRQSFKLGNRFKEKYSFVYTIREKIPVPVKRILLPKTIYATLDGFILPSVSQWLKRIDEADFVITDSFHCVVFCILFHKRFIALPNQSNKKGMNERFKVLFKKTGLEYRLLSGNENDDEVKKKINMPVNWAAVDEKIDIWRKESLMWLNNALR